MLAGSRSCECAPHFDCINLIEGAAYASRRRYISFVSHSHFSLSFSDPCPLQKSIRARTKCVLYNTPPLPARASSNGTRPLTRAPCRVLGQRRCRSALSPNPRVSSIQWLGRRRSSARHAPSIDSQRRYCAQPTFPRSWAAAAPCHVRVVLSCFSRHLSKASNYGIIFSIYRRKISQMCLHIWETPQDWSVPYQVIASFVAPAVSARLLVKWR